MIKPANQKNNKLPFGNVFVAHNILTIEIYDFLYDKINISLKFMLYSGGYTSGYGFTKN